jgi:putative ABC transport system permease protein
MWRVVVRQIRGRRGRSLAMLLGVLVATTGFTVLTGTTETSRLTATELVHANSRATYDILVRSPDAVEGAERRDHLVRPNYLNGQYGGISLAQWRRIRDVAGVEVAAPVALIGYTPVLATAEVDVTSQLDRALVRQMIRVQPAWSADGGLTRAVEPQARYVYVTRRPIAVAAPGPDGDGYLAPDGTSIPGGTLAALGCMVPYPFLELDDSGRWRPLCGTWFLALNRDTSRLELNQAEFAVYQALDDGAYLDFRRVIDPAQPHANQARGDRFEPVRRSAVTFGLSWPLWFSIAGVEPTEEARLAGLDKAIVSGSYLPAESSAVDAAKLTTIPVLLANRTPAGDRLAVTTDRIAGDGTAGVSPVELLNRLSGAAGTGRRATEFDVGTIYAGLLQTLDSSARLDLTVQSGQPQYTADGEASLRPRPFDNDSAIWQTDVSQFGEQARGAAALQPYLANDIGFRPVGPTSVHKLTRLVDPPRTASVGVFDPNLTTGSSALAAVPMETYHAPNVVGADESSRKLLQDRPLGPSNNPAHYLIAPPAMLTTIDAAARLLDRPDPLSAIRIRVRGVNGVDPASRERVRLVAEEITRATGLDVDITVGSSIQPRTIALPAGKFGRPDLLLHEGWSKKGVAVAIIHAADRKSLILFGLILVVCVLFLANAVSASVRDRRREFAVLACLGWSPSRRSTLILLETACIGSAAGIVGISVAAIIAQFAAIDFSWRRAGFALPIAITVTLLAGLVPALRAARAHPASALRPTVVAPRRALPPRRLSGLALTNVVRTPGRSLLGASSLALGIAGLVVIAAVMLDFDGTVVGTLLGDAVSVQVRTTDLLAVGTAVVLGVVAVSDALYLGIRERASEFATLRAVGWSESELRRLVLMEAAVISMFAVLSGLFVGVAAIKMLADIAIPRIIAMAAVTGGFGILLGAIAAAVPVLLLNRVRLATLQSEE